MPDGEPSEKAVTEPPGEPGPPPDGDRARWDRHLDEQEEESFPASDPHGDWSGPSN